jgi:hypothetical protein
MITPWTTTCHETLAQEGFLAYAVLPNPNRMCDRGAEKERRSARRRRSGESHEAIAYTVLRGERIVPRIGIDKRREGQRTGVLRTPTESCAE